MIHLYLHSTLCPILDFSEKLNKLPLTVQKHILRRKQKIKKEISLRGYVLLQKALQKDFGIELDQLTFLPSGKPVIKDQNIFFNISHSGNLVGVAISRSGTIGLDIEKFRKFEKIESSFAFFSKVEQQAILDAELPDEKLIELWSKKEAFVKAIGGEMFEMSNYTDVRFSTTFWIREPYYFHSIPTKFKGQIWLTSSFPTKNIHITQSTNL